MYNKLREGGYPAEKSEREAVCRRLNIARWPSALVSNPKSNCARLASRPAFTSNPRAADCSLRTPFTVGSDGPEALTEPPIGASEHPTFPQLGSVAGALNTALETSHQLPTHDPCDLKLSGQSEWAMNQDGNYDQFVDTDLNLFGVDFIDDVAGNPSHEAGPDMSDETSPPAHPSHTNVSSYSPEMYQEDREPFGSYNLQQTKLSEHQQSIVDVPDLEDTPSPFSTSTFPATPRYLGTAVNGHSKARPLDRWNPKFRNPKSINPDRNSSSTYDSGYGSGRSSPFSFQAVERPSRRITPAPSFNGLYRVPCKSFHEPRKLNGFYSPQPTDRYREVDTCRKCRYSSIHNLSWSAAKHYLKFEVFETELKLPETYEVAALDAAGNSALHYAAIGGADMEVITVLIRSGVDPCRINTSGELFLHCLRPHFDQSNLDFEKCLFPTFRTNLVNLLNDMGKKCNGFFRWRDNAGRTALEKFVSRITDGDLQARIKE